MNERFAEFYTTLVKEDCLRSEAVIRYLLLQLHTTGFVYTVTNQCIQTRGCVFFTEPLSFSLKLAILATTQ